MVDKGRYFFTSEPSCFPILVVNRHIVVSDQPDEDEDYDPKDDRDEEVDHNFASHRVSSLLLLLVLPLARMLYRENGYMDFKMTK